MKQNRYVIADKAGDTIDLKIDKITLADLLDFHPLNKLKELLKKLFGKE